MVTPSQLFLAFVLAPFAVIFTAASAALWYLIYRVVREDLRPWALTWLSKNEPYVWTFGGAVVITLAAALALLS